MKNKILTFIIGALAGAIITTAGFYIYESVTDNRAPYGGEKRQMIDGETPPDRPEKGNRPNMKNENTTNAETNNI